MRKVLAITLLVLFTAAVLSPAVFAECNGKSHSSKTAEGSAPKTTKA